jgi:hypothetical protein
VHTSNPPSQRGGAPHGRTSGGASTTAIALLLQFAHFNLRFRLVEDRAVLADERREQPALRALAARASAGDIEAMVGELAERDLEPGRLDALARGPRRREQQTNRPQLVTSHADAESRSVPP